MCVLGRAAPVHLFLAAAILKTLKRSRGGSSRRCRAGDPCEARGCAQRAAGSSGIQALETTERSRDVLGDGFEVLTAVPDALAVAPAGTAVAVPRAAVERQAQKEGLVPGAKDDPPLCVCYGSGDVTLDGAVSSGDAQLAYYIALGMHQATPLQPCRADCNSDGVVSAGDAQLIFYAALGMGGCPANVPNGECCEDDDGACASGHRQNGFCCAVGDCCGEPVNCPDGTGFCEPLPAGTDHGFCAGEDATCGGTCAGAGGCQFPAQGLQCGSCMQCDGGGSCEAVANGADPFNDCAICQVCNGAGGCGIVLSRNDPMNECGALSCAGCYYGWSGDPCYRRADLAADAVGCNGGGACQTAANVCPSAPQGPSTPVHAQLRDTLQRPDGRHLYRHRRRYLHLRAGGHRPRK